MNRRDFIKTTAAAAALAATGAGVATAAPPRLGVSGCTCGQPSGAHGEDCPELRCIHGLHMGKDCGACAAGQTGLRLRGPVLADRPGSTGCHTDPAGVTVPEGGVPLTLGVSGRQIGWCDEFTLEEVEGVQCLVATAWVTDPVGNEVLSQELREGTPAAFCGLRMGPVPEGWTLGDRVSGVRATAIGLGDSDDPLARMRIG